MVFNSTENYKFSHNPFYFHSHGGRPLKCLPIAQQHFQATRANGRPLNAHPVYMVILRPVVQFPVRLIIPCDLTQKFRINLLSLAVIQPSKRMCCCPVKLYFFIYVHKAVIYDDLSKSISNSSIFYR